MYHIFVLKDIQLPRIIIVGLITYWGLGNESHGDDICRSVMPSPSLNAGLGCIIIQ